MRREKGLTPLSQYVKASDPAVGAVVSAWLAPYYAVEGVPRLLTRMELSPHAVLVNREGHQFSRFGVSFHAPEPADTGILARQREIEGLQKVVIRVQALRVTRICAYMTLIGCHKTPRTGSKVPRHRVIEAGFFVVPMSPDDTQ